MPGLDDRTAAASPEKGGRPPLPEPFVFSLLTAVFIFFLPLRVVPVPGGRMMLPDPIGWALAAVALLATGYRPLRRLSLLAVVGLTVSATHNFIYRTSGTTAAVAGAFLIALAAEWLLVWRLSAAIGQIAREVGDQRVGRSAGRAPAVFALHPAATVTSLVLFWAFAGGSVAGVFLVYGVLLIGAAALCYPMFLLDAAGRMCRRATAGDDDPR